MGMRYLLCIKIRRFKHSFAPIFANMLNVLPSLALLTLGICCGSAGRTKRIVGGDSIQIQVVPYMLSFMVNDSHICGASIISSEWGMTAAHCAIEYSTDPFVEITIRSGSSLLGRGGTVHNITRLVWHSRFDPKTDDYDIALFKVKPPFRFSSVAQPIDLPEENDSPSDLAVVTGWGYFKKSFSAPSLSLKYVVVPRVSQDNCLRDYIGHYAVTPRDVCYGLKEGGKDSCKGDSGGPLVSREKVQFGITSWGDGCAKAKSPGVYTRVSLFRDWIKRHAGV